MIYYYFSHFKNHPAERKWVEFNSRVNYPIKQARNAMVNDDLINMDDDMNKFCVYRGYYTVARRYEFYVQVARPISHE